MKKLFYLLSIIASVVCLTSCGGKCRNCNATPQIPLATFPVAVNDQWTYQVTYNNQNLIDTAVFSITGTIYSGTDSMVYSTKTMIKDTLVDSGTVLTTPQTLFYRPSGNQGLFSFLKLRFPITRSSAWQGYYPGDTLNVSLLIQPYQVMNTNYDYALEINRNYLTPGFAIQDVFDVVNGVGIAEETIIITQGPVANSRTMKLIRYTLH